MKEELLYQIALTQVRGIGDVRAKQLVRYCGSARQVFKEKLPVLMKIPGAGAHMHRGLWGRELFRRAEAEIRTMEQNGIRALFYRDKDYPARLKECEDGPFLLYIKGNANLNHPRVVAVVGSRNMTAYGRTQCEEIIRDLVPHRVMVVSGLAYGVDACAHRSALDHNLLTVAVLGHGLDRIYPRQHHKLAGHVMTTGALLSDYITGSVPGPENFPKRNRIIAGLCDAIIVIEAAITGGALITANIANTYNRDVFALPGKIHDKFSQGCNKLIKIHKAHLMETAADIEYIMNWEPVNGRSRGAQTSLFASLSDEEKTVAGFLKSHPGAGIDHIVAGTGFNLSKVTSLLLSLEFKQVVRPLPGKTFQLRP